MRMKKIICFVLALLLCCSAVACKPQESGGDTGGEIPDTSTYLVENGASEYKIVIPAQATATEEFAASELAQFFADCVGEEPQTVTDDSVEADLGGKYLSVGDTSLYEKSGMTLDRAELGTDGYKILTEGNTVIMNAAGENGKMYAVYEFLKNNLGVNFYAADEISTPAADDVFLKDFDMTDIPDFRGRDVHYYSFFYNINPNFAVRMRLTSRRTIFSEENGEGSPWSSLWAHEQFKILPYEEYGASHEDWYVYNEAGKPISLCWTDTDLQAQFIENLKKFIDAEPDKIFFSIAQEDGAVIGEGECDCAECVASDARYTHSGTMMRFNNAIARAIKQAYPDREIYLVAFAYQGTIEAPVVRDAQGNIVLDENGKAQPVDPSVVGEDNVIIRYAPLYNCYSHDFMDEVCNEQVVHMSQHSAKPRDAIIGWSAVVQHMAAWNYCTAFGAYPVNFNNFSTIQQNYRTMRDYGFIDVLDQGPSDTTGTPLESLRIYVQSQLMWDVDRNFNALVDDFMNNYYKDAAAEMKEYYEYVRLHYAYLEATCEDRNGFHFIPSGAGFSQRIVDEDYFPLETLNNFKEILDRALAKANAVEDAQLRETLVRRVEAETLQYRYLQLELYRDHYAQLGDGVLASMIDEFESVCAASGLTHYGENKPMQEKLTEWRNEL